MELIADRFMVARVEADAARPAGRHGGRGVRLRPATDLATGAVVTLIESSAGGASEHLHWLLRCGRLAAVQHAHLAALLDYGPIGEGRRFEAWRGRVGWRGAAATAARARSMVDAYLSASDLSPCVAPLLAEDNGRAVIIPDAAAARELVAGGARVLTPGAPDACGIELIARPAIAAVSELLGDAERREPGALALWGMPGCGLRTAIATLARAARLQGFVPVAAGVADPDVWRLVGDRSVLLIDHVSRSHISRGSDGRVSDGMGDADACVGWRRLLERTTQRARAHLLLLAGPRPLPRVRSLELGSLPETALVEAVRPHAWQQWPAVARAAATAGGSPGRFAAALWRPAGANSTPADRLLAAERPPLYGTATEDRGDRRDVSEATPVAAMAARSGTGTAGRKMAASRAWPVSGDVAALRAKLGAASAALQTGRFASAERESRSVLAALARRRDWCSVVPGALALADALAARGRMGEARRALDDARAWAEQGGDVAGLGDVAIAHSGRLVDEGRLAEAEASARSAMAAAAARDDRLQAARATVALSRALFWQARFREAHDCVDARLPDAVGAIAVALAAAAARAAVGLPGEGRAHALSAQALTASARLEDPASQAASRSLAAFVHLAAGDLDAARQAAAQAVTAARSARRPWLALRARWLAAEAERRAGRQAAATRLLARVERLSATAGGHTMRARLMLMRQLLSGVPPTEAVERLSGSLGLPALALFAPADQRAVSRSAALDEVLALVAPLHAAGDDHAALSGVCAVLRGQLRAAGVAFIAAGAVAGRSVAGDGHAIDPSLALRAISVGRPLAAEPPSTGAELAVPVRYGERSLGALAARWHAASAPGERAAALLTMAAALAAPAFAAAARPQAPSPADDILGESDGIRAVRLAVERAAPVPYPVLVEGESGSGKELVARALHRRGPRRDRAFVAVNCAALPDDLVEAELFGHARGAFTGAVIERLGVFEEAHGGTLFLDEVGELSPRAQAKLLRTLQENEVRRVGENTARRIDVRVVAATNRNLRQEVAAGRFRLDLLYRLDVVRIVVPPLRERVSDLPLLIERCWREATERVHSRAVLSAATVAALARHPWPGNVRELQNVMASLAVRAPRRGVVTPAALPWSCDPSPHSLATPLEAARRQFEAQFVQAALARSGGHRGRAAAELGVTRQGLAKLMTRLELGTAAGG